MPRVFLPVDGQHPRQQFDLVAEEAHRDRSGQESRVLKNHFSKGQIGRVLAERDGSREVRRGSLAVSYTHLDVYKRQG